MFSFAVSIGSRLKNWKMKPMCVAPQLRQLRVVELADRGAGDVDLAGGRPVEPGEDVHQRGLAGARRAHDGGQPPLATSTETPRRASTAVSPRAVAAGEAVGGDDGRRRAVARLLLDLEHLHLWGSFVRVAGLRASG